MLKSLLNLLGIAKKNVTVNVDRIVKCGQSTRFNLDQWLRIEEARMLLGCITPDQYDLDRKLADAVYENGVVDIKLIYAKAV